MIKTKFQKKFGAIAAHVLYDVTAERLDMDTGMKLIEEFLDYVVFNGHKSAQYGNECISCGLSRRFWDTLLCPNRAEPPNYWEQDATG